MIAPYDEDTAMCPDFDDDETLPSSETLATERGDELPGTGRAALAVLGALLAFGFLMALILPR